MLEILMLMWKVLFRCISVWKVLWRSLCSWFFWGSYMVLVSVMVLSVYLVVLLNVRFVLFGVCWVLIVILLIVKILVFVLSFILLGRLSWK